MAQIKVHDVSYQLPESFTLKEMRVIERYTGGVLEGFGISKICGVIHVAIMRAKPELGFDEIQEVIDDLPVEDLEQITEAVAGQSPPAENNSESNGSSNDDSATSSDAGQESATPESSGSPDLAGFRSFHATSRS